MAASKGNPFFAGFLAGLFTGLALCVAVALLVTRNNPFVQEPAAQEAGASQKAAAGGSPMEAPKYEFYQAPPVAPATAPVAPVAPTPPAAAAASPHYFLQAGAYGNAADADQLKARLSLLGFEVNILTAQEGEKTLYKVRVGPFKGLDELNSARTRLTQSGMETILVKIPEQEKQ